MLNTHSDTTNGTAVNGCYILYMHFTCGPGVIADEMMEMVMVERYVWNNNRGLNQTCILPETLPSTN